MSKDKIEILMKLIFTIISYFLTDSQVFLEISIPEKLDVEKYDELKEYLQKGFVLAVKKFDLNKDFIVKLFVHL